MADKFEQMPYLYGKLNQEVKTMLYAYTGISTDTIDITIDNENLTISADVVPATKVELDALL